MLGACHKNLNVLMNLKLVSQDIIKMGSSFIYPSQKAPKEVGNQVSKTIKLCRPLL